MVMVSYAHVYCVACQPLPLVCLLLQPIRLPALFVVVETNSSSSLWTCLKIDRGDIMPPGLSVISHHNPAEFQTGSMANHTHTRWHNITPLKTYSKWQTFVEIKIVQYSIIAIPLHNVRIVTIYAYIGHSP